MSHVGYIKFIDVWFLVTTVFIFASLLEFALVNVIFRSAKYGGEWGSMGSMGEVEETGVKGERVEGN